MARVEALDRGAATGRAKARAHASAQLAPPFWLARQTAAMPCCVVLTTLLVAFAISGVGQVIKRSTFNTVGLLSLPADN